MKSFYPTTIIVIISILTSCSGKIGPDHETGHAISFSVSQSFSAEVTKASLFEPEDLKVMDADHSHEGNFRVMAYNSDTDGRYFDNPEWIHFIYYPTNPQSSRWHFWNGTSIYTRYWSISHALDFFAYMPYDQSGSGITTNFDNKTISCELPVDMHASGGNPAQDSTAGQEAAQEFVYAYSSGYTYETDNGNVELNFIHPLTAIYFKLGEAHGNTVIHSVGLSGLHNTGTLNVSQNPTQGDLEYSDWNIPTGATRGDMTISINKTVGGSGSQGIQLNSPIGGPYLVMPQATATSQPTSTPASTEDIYITVSFTWNGTNTVARVKLGGDGWKPGYKYTYTLTLGDNEEDILANVDITPWNVIDHKNNIEIE